MWSLWKVSCIVKRTSSISKAGIVRGQMEAVLEIVRKGGAELYASWERIVLPE